VPSGGEAFPEIDLLEILMMNRSRSRAAAARSSRRIVMAVSETLEPRRLMAAPQVVVPAPFPEPGTPLGPDGHFEFELDPAQKVVAKFDQSVTLASGAMSLTNLTTAEAVTELDQTCSAQDLSYTWTVGQADPQNMPGILPPGNYELLFNADKVTNGGSEELDGNLDGTGGDDYVSGFFFQPADANHDRAVDGGDYGQIDNSIQMPGSRGFSNGDFNYDGVIDGGDYGVMDNNIQAQGAAFPTSGD
jgi:hypothetical protein